MQKCKKFFCIYYGLEGFRIEELVLSHSIKDWKNLGPIDLVGLLEDPVLEWVPLITWFRHQLT